MVELLGVEEERSRSCWVKIPRRLVCRFIGSVSLGVVRLHHHKCHQDDRPLIKASPPTFKVLFESLLPLVRSIFTPDHRLPSFADKHSPYPSGTPTSSPQHVWFVRRYSICHSFLFLVLLFHHRHAMLRLYDDPHDQSPSPPFPHAPFALVLSCKLVICDLTRPPSPRAAYTSRLLCL